MKIPPSLLLILTFALITIGLGWRVAFLEEKVAFVEDERDQAVNVATGKKDSTTFYKNKYGEEVAKVKQTEISQGNLKRLLETRDLSSLKHFDDINKRMSNIESLVTTSMSIRADSIPLVPVIVRDSIKAFEWKIKDEFNDIYAVVLDTPKFIMNVPVHTVAIWQRRKFFGLRIGKRDWFTESFTPNKLVKIDSITSFMVKKKR